MCFTDSVLGWTYNTSRNTSQYILANNLTANLIPEHVCDQHSFLLMVVCSAPNNFDARNAIRNTWGKKHTINGQEVSTYFLIGETLNSSLQVNLIRVVIPFNNSRLDNCLMDFMFIIEFIVSSLLLSIAPYLI